MSTENNVKNRMIEYVLNNAKKGCLEDIVSKIDYFCWQGSHNEGNWLMNIGDKKGDILANEIYKKQPQNVLELGTFCGYSALRIISALPSDGHLYTIETISGNIEFAKQLINYAGVQDKITFLHGDLASSINEIKNKYNINFFDCVFIDHEKEIYLSDFQLLETSKLLTIGSIIIADNVLYPGSPEYKTYVTTNQDKYETVIHETTVEYTKNLADQVLITTIKS